MVALGYRWRTVAAVFAKRPSPVNISAGKALVEAQKEIANA
jgi:hypothetical protein